MLKGWGRAFWTHFCPLATRVDSWSRPLSRGLSLSFCRIKFFLFGYPGGVLCTQYHSTLQYPFFCAKWKDERDRITYEAKSTTRRKAEDVSFPSMRRRPRKNGGQGFIYPHLFAESINFLPWFLTMVVSDGTVLRVVLCSTSPWESSFG